jgi:hypothetical protein
MASTIAPKKAGQKPFTIKPDTSFDASCIIRALITRRKSPNVNIEIGRVKIFNKKPNVALINPITIAAIKADPKPFTTNPGII